MWHGGLSVCGTCVAGGGGNKGAIDCIDRGEGDTAPDSPGPQAPVDQTPIQARQLRKGLQLMSYTNALRCKGAHLHRLLCLGLSSYHARNRMFKL